MKDRINNKGFTLIELIATIVILGLVLGFSSYAIIGTLNKTKEKNYDLLISNIKSASETYYQECKFSRNEKITCSETITLNNLIDFGYLKENSDDSQKIINPKDDVDISNCQIKVTEVNNNIVVTSVEPFGSCPTTY